jgi:hypothetical protein
MLDFRMDKDQLEYGQSSKGVEFVLAGSDAPFPPVGVAITESAFNILMPILQSNFPNDFGLLIKLAGLTVSDDVWNIIDPTSILPRNPATFVMDLAGTGNWLVDIFDPKVAANMSDEIPGEIQSVSLNELILSIAGADLTGTGAFTLDNTDLTTFDGFPKPVGAVGLKLIGGNDLLDKLVAMGMVPQDGATNARMMMGLFARLVEGTEDTMTSQIEIEENGSVLANGQRLR